MGTMKSVFERISSVMEDDYLPDRFSQGFDYSANRTVVEYAAQTMIKKGWSPSASAKDTAKKLHGYDNMMIGKGVVLIDEKKLEDALWSRMVDSVIKNRGDMRDTARHHCVSMALNTYNQKHESKTHKELSRRVSKKLGYDVEDESNNDKG